MSKHTPGPWVIKEIDRDEGVRVSFGLVGCGCRVYGMPEGEANARLIAAAPDLLAALESVLTVGDIDQSPGTNGRVVLHQVRAAIANAKG
jgi:hypothetical protein